MAGSIEAANSLSQRIARSILRRNVLWLVLLVLVLAGLSAGVPQLRFSSDNRAFFGNQTQDFKDLQMLDRTYSGASGLLFMVIPPEGEAFSPATLTALRAMTGDAWQIPHVLRIDSPVNYSHSYASGDELIVEPLLDDFAPVTPADAERFRDIVMAQDTLRDRLVAADGRAFGIGVQVVPPEDGNARQEIADFMAGLAARWQAENPGFRVHMTGGILGGLALVEAAIDDIFTFVPLAFVVVTVLLALMLRSAIGVITAMVVVVSGTIATLGFAGWCGIVLTAGTAISPLSVMVLIAASCIHLMLSYVRARQSGDAAPVESALAENLGAITVTNLTTAFGFLCLNFALSPPLREMGNIVAFGLMFGLAATLVVLPFGLARDHSKMNRIFMTAAMMQHLSDFVRRHFRLWLWLFPVAVVVSITGILRIGFDDNLVRYFDDRYVFRQDAEAIKDRLTGLDTLQFSFSAPGGTSVFEPDFLRAVDRFQTWLVAQPVVVSASSVTGLIKHLHGAMNGDDPAERRIADSREANAQLMMFYEMSLPVGMDLNASLDIDRTQLLVSAILRTEHSAQIRGLAADAEAWMATHEPRIATRAAGVSIAFARMAQQNNSQMLIGLAVVLALISATMMLTLRSVKMGLISLAPNLVPAVLAFGLWGFTFGNVNLGSTVVTTMTFGIVVDDTVHFLMHYLRRRRAGLNAQAAMRDTFSVVGAAIVITSVALIAGFAIMMLSGFAINQHIGALTVFVVGFALLADLLFLPAILLALEGDKE